MSVRKVLLYIEDNSANMRLVESFVTKLGFEFHGSANGEEGIKKARALKPDLILMDMALPGIDGVEATKRLKSEEETQHIPIIAVTARVSTRDENRALEAGCSDYITKPIDLKKLVATLERIADISRPKPRPKLPEKYARVLLVDDTPDNIMILTKFFKENGIEVYVANNGAEALDLLLNEKIDFIISDILMPEMDGFELCYTIRKTPQFSHVPFIFYSAYFYSSQDDVFADKIGASGYFQSPIKLQDFYSNVETILRQYKDPKINITENEFRTEHIKRFRTKLLLTAQKIDTFTGKSAEYPLESGSSFVIEEESPRRIYEVMRRKILDGSSGLCLTREHPETLKRKLGIESARTNIVWLSDTEVEGHVSTNNLTSISIIAWDFLQKVTNGVIVLDGFEYLCSQHTYERCLNFVQVLKERVSTKDSMFLLSINPKALEQQEYMKLKKEFITLEPST